VTDSRKPTANSVQPKPTRNSGMPGPGLVVLAGLPGTGKSAIAAPLARRLQAAYLRIDTIEQSLVNSGELSAAPYVVGYLTGYALAADQLRVGLSTVVECVNPLKITRDAWHQVAVEHDCWIIEVELICSDQDEHRSRVEGRSSDIPGLVLPTWQQVRERHYEPWDRDHLLIDTSITSVDHAVHRIHQHARTYLSCAY
jgi:predicted kinase